MKIHFYKYQGTANDFILLDNREDKYNALTITQREFLCHRRWGIGADGLMLLNKKEGFDFEMKYYNADGKESSMCGNGGRCITAFAFDRGIQKEIYLFWAIDGIHEATKQVDLVKLKMTNVESIQQIDHHIFVLNTGSPHYVTFVEDISVIDVEKEGSRICQSFVEGINVNFVQQKEINELIVRTYERGVFAETWSCGTGSVACALVQSVKENLDCPISIQTKGGTLKVNYQKKENKFMDIWLAGSAQKVYEGNIEI